MPGFKCHVFSKAIAVVSFFFGMAFVILGPIVLASNFEFEDSWPAIRNLLIMFFPVVISGIAILTTKSESPGTDFKSIFRKKWG